MLRELCLLRYEEVIVLAVSDALNAFYQNK
jgi:hypothetical protein